jgi:hypothetical protein
VGADLRDLDTFRASPFDLAFVILPETECTRLEADYAENELFLDLLEAAVFLSCYP